MKRQNAPEDDVPFDVGPAAPAPAEGPVTPPKDILSASKVEAVRFHPAKPGYAYDQVETFVDAVIRTLRYLEQRMYQDDLALHEAEQENELLNEQIATLKATIEVFRANGDPVGSADGGFVTASSLDDSGLRAERDELAAALEAAQTEVAELRAYIDEQLAPWIAEQEEADADLPGDVPEGEANDDDETVSDVVAPEQALPAEEDSALTTPAAGRESAISELPEETEIDEKAVFAATAAAFAAQVEQSDDWDDFGGEALDDSTDPADLEATEGYVAPEESPRATGPQFSTPEIEALGVAIDPRKVIPTDDAQYERVSPPKAGTPLPRLLPPEIAAMMEDDDQS